MSRQDYRKGLRCLLPKGAIGLDVQKAGEGQQSAPSCFVELRRWSRPFIPFDFQAAIISCIRARCREGAFSGLVSLPTGSGKTLTAARVLLEVLSDQSARAPVAIWIAPQRELLHQASEAIQSAWWNGVGPNSLDVRVIRTSAEDLSIGRGTCILLTPMMALNLADDLAHLADCVVFDEAHHAAADVFAETWSRYTKQPGKHGPALALGLSATPTRKQLGEIRNLRELFDNNLIVPAVLGKEPVRTLIERGVLSSPSFAQIKGVPPYSIWKGPSDTRSLRSFVLDLDRWTAIVTFVQHSDKQHVVYALDREHGRALTRHLRFVHVNAEYIDGETAITNRVAILERFRNKETQTLVNVGLLVEGVDCPAADTVVLTFPIKSEPRLRQMIGRVLRGPAAGGTASCQVASIDGSASWLDSVLYSAPFRYDGWKLMNCEA